MKTLGLLMLSVLGLVAAGVPWAMWLAGAPVVPRHRFNPVELIVWASFAGLLYVCSYAIAASTEIRSLKTRLRMAGEQL